MTKCGICQVFGDQIQCSSTTANSSGERVPCDNAGLVGHAGQDQLIKALVWVNKGNGQKLVTIPKSAAIEGGDIVLIKKLK